jgi:hypothetical protein
MSRSARQRTAELTSRLVAAGQKPGICVTRVFRKSMSVEYRLRKSRSTPTTLNIINMKKLNLSFSGNNFQNRLIWF